MRFLFCLLSLSVLSACGSSGKVEQGAPSEEFPETRSEEIKSERGKLTGEEGFALLGGKKDNTAGGAAIGVNGFLWRATLDTLSFMPLASADPFGGVILTDWYEDPNAPGERFKVNAVILDKTLRADGVRISVFKQVRDGGNWRDQKLDEKLGRRLEDTVLTRARQLKIAQAK